MLTARELKTATLGEQAYIWYGRKLLAVLIRFGVTVIIIIEDLVILFAGTYACEQLFDSYMQCDVIHLAHQKRSLFKVLIDMPSLRDINGCCLIFTGIHVGATLTTRLPVYSRKIYSKVF